MVNDKFDLNELVKQPAQQISITVNTDDPLKRESDIRLREAEARHQRVKDLLLHILTSTILMIVVLLCVWLIMQKSLASDEGKQALGLLTTIVMPCWDTSQGNRQNSSVTAPTTATPSAPAT